MPFRHVAQHVLRQWREAERKHTAATDPDLKAELLREMTRLRQAYREKIDQARIAGLPVPPDVPA